MRVNSTAFMKPPPHALNNLPCSRRCEIVCVIEMSEEERVTVETKEREKDEREEGVSV